MRSARLAARLCALGFALAAPGQASSQHLELQQRVDSLRVQAGRASQRFLAFEDSVRADRERLDSSRVGPYRILAQRPLMPMATTAARMALDSLTPHLGATMARMERFVVVFRAELPDSTENSKRRDTTLAVEFVKNGSTIHNISVRYDTSAAMMAIRLYTPNLVFREAAPSFLAWLGGGAPLGSLNVEDWRSLRLGLVSSPAVVGRRCFQGDLTACFMTLQIALPPDPVTAWYDGNDRRRIVRGNEDRLRRVDAQAYRNCVDGYDFSCISLLRKLPLSELPAATWGLPRGPLARYAVQIGGAGAVERMLEGEREPMQRLAAAAKLPADTLVMRWRQMVHDAPAPSRDLPIEVVWVTALWTVGLGALSLRSSRWR